MIRIAVPLDGSKLAEAAIGHVMAIAKAYPAQITLLRVLSETPREETMPVDTVDWKLQRRQVEAYLIDVAQRLRATDPAVRWHVEEGRAAQTIHRFCADKQTDLVVLSRFGKGGITDFRAGGTALKVVASCPVSVLLVGPSNETSTDNEPRYRRILAPVDGSLSAELAVGMASMIAQAHEADLHLVHVVEQAELPSRMVQTRDLHDVVDRMDRYLRSEAMRRLEGFKAQLPAGIRVHTEVLSARNIASALHAISEAEDVDLIVLSAHSEDKEPGWRYGSVCEALLSHTTRPVLVLQQAQAQLGQRFQSIHLAEPQADAG